MMQRSRKWYEWRKPLALSASMVGVVAVAVLIGLSAGVSYAQDNGAGGTQSSEPGFIKNLHITGFAQNTSATWIESNNMAHSYGSTTDPAMSIAGAGQAKTRLRRSASWCRSTLTTISPRTTACLCAPGSRMNRRILGNSIALERARNGRGQSPDSRPLRLIATRISTTCTGSANCGSNIALAHCSSSWAARS